MWLNELPKRNSIRVGPELVVPTSALKNFLCDTVRTVFYETSGECAFLGYGGTASLLRINNVNVMVVTRHQSGLERDGSPDEAIIESIRVSAFGGEQLSNITFNSLVYVTSQLGEEYEDIVLLIAVRQDRSGNKESPYFFNYNNDDAELRSKRLKSVIVGCPSMPDVIDYEKNHAKIYPSIRDCKFDADFSSEAKFIKRFSYCENKMIPIDGCSGGSVYSLVDGSDGFQMVHEGIVVRGGSGSVYIVDTEFLVEMMKNH